jgi:ribulose-5-phosphate 4-epimerase/fuculose-1-phosphate aldolase
MLDEGYIKFRLEWEEAPAPDVPAALLQVRDRLHALGLVGMYADSGIGFGNVSVRMPDGQILISGSGTGAVAQSSPGLFSTVIAYDIPRNWVHCRGPVPASSETLTHAMLYACDPQIGAVLHVHQLAAWNRLLHRVPTTQADTPYGTPEMALEVKRLYEGEELPKCRFLAMAGHEEGMIAFGNDCWSAMAVLEKWIFA